VLKHSGTTFTPQNGRAVSEFVHVKTLSGRIKIAREDHSKLAWGLHPVQSSLHSAGAKTRLTREVAHGLEGSKDYGSAGWNGNQHVRLRVAQVT
jgi:hypothetical protein